MRRDRISIIADILEVLNRKQIPKTAIVYSANLNFNRASLYLDMMLRKNLIEKESNKYMITNLGKEYLHKINDLEGIFDGENPFK